MQARGEQIDEGHLLAGHPERTGTQHGAPRPRTVRLALVHLVVVRGRRGATAGARVENLLRDNNGHPILDNNGMNILPEPPNEDAVMALAAFCNQPKLQSEFATMTNYGPGTEEAFEELSEEQVEKLPNAPTRTNVLHDDPVYFAENYSKIEETATKAIGE